VIAAHQDGVHVVDLAVPEHPVELARAWTMRPGDGGYDPWEGARDVQIDPVTNRIYVVDRVRGLLIYQLD